MRLFHSALVLAFAVTLPACGEPDKDGDGYSDLADCEPENAAINPGADEICDGVDNNCDGFTDDAANVVDAPVWFLDRDNDGSGDDTVTEASCEAPGAGWAAAGGDCDDTDPLAHPGSTEICNGVDDDCDGVADEPEEASGTELWFEDWDFDSYGDPATGQYLCPQQVPRLWVQNGDDCDDRDRDQYPGADEYCNGEDDDCDEAVDELEEVVDGFYAYEDDDEDGYGNPATEVWVCEMPARHVDNAKDCKDTDSVVALGCGCTTGEDGDLTVAAGTTTVLEGGEHHFGNVVVQARGTLRFEGNEPVYLFADRVEVQGTIDVSGDGTTPGAGGGAGGSGSTCYTSGNAGRNAYGASGGGGSVGTVYYYSVGGGGGGHVDAGSSGGTNTYYGGAGGAGGKAYGDRAFEEYFAGGGGGASGTANGASGGGGGGAIKIVAGEIIVAGTIDASGSNGVPITSTSCYYGGGGGGGGAGGSIWLHGDRIALSGSLLFDGGTGSAGQASRTSPSYYMGTTGGNGSVGRARLSAQVLVESGSTSDRPWVDMAEPSCDSPFADEEG